MLAISSAAETVLAKDKDRTTYQHHTTSIVSTHDLIYALVCYDALLSVVGMGLTRLLKYLMKLQILVKCHL